MKKQDTNKLKPIKRFEELKSLSREHHFGLLLCWKIRQGIQKNIDLERIRKYTYWFWESQLQNHFEIEENYIFPILGDENALVKQAKKEHKELKILFESELDLNTSLTLLEQQLQNHIRFEERVLFNEIQKVATEKDLIEIAKVHNSNFQEDWEDQFWID